MWEKKKLNVSVWVEKINIETHTYLVQTEHQWIATKTKRITQKIIRSLQQHIYAVWTRVFIFQLNASPIIWNHFMKYVKNGSWINFISIDSVISISSEAGRNVEKSAFDVLRALYAHRNSYFQLSKFIIFVFKSQTQCNLACECWTFSDNAIGNKQQWYKKSQIINDFIKLLITLINRRSFFKLEHMSFSLTTIFILFKNKKNLVKLNILR